jgi:transcriptional regulator with AAA-type ATPase domain
VATNVGERFLSGPAESVLTVQRDLARLSVDLYRGVQARVAAFFHETLEVVREGSRRPIPQPSNGPTDVGQRTARGLLGALDAGADFSCARVIARHGSGGFELHVDHGEPMPDAVVDVARDPVALLRRGEKARHRRVLAQPVVGLLVCAEEAHELTSGAPLCHRHPREGDGENGSSDEAAAARENVARRRVLERADSRQGGQEHGNGGDRTDDRPRHFGDPDDRKQPHEDRHVRERDQRHAERKLCERETSGRSNMSAIGRRDSRGRDGGDRERRQREPPSTAAGPRFGGSSGLRDDEGDQGRKRQERGRPADLGMQRGRVGHGNRDARVTVVAAQMGHDITVREPARSLPLVALRVEVVQGPDAGRVLVASNDVVSVGSADGNDLVLDDATVSRFHLELERSATGVRISDLESTNGTFVGTTRIERAIVARDTLVGVGRAVLRVGDGGGIEVPLLAGDELAGLRGRSLPMRKLMLQVERAAKSEVTVLVVGESGTGKELVARALHELGPRRPGPFVTVDCGALAPTLIASELFGHEKGAFTGANQQHKGAFEQAHKGTLFLDEIGELPAQLQTTLLGALERRRFRRLGGRSDVEVDVRVVCATNRDLRAEVNRGTFRLDLFYRIAVVSLNLPPLRERKEDVPLLVEHFMRAAGHEEPTETVFPPKAMIELSEHRWSGNVRELKNLVEATLAMGETPPLSMASPATGNDTSTSGDPLLPLLSLKFKDARARLLTDFEARYLQHLWARADQSISRAAQEAGVDRSHLTHLLKRHGLR